MKACDISVKVIRRDDNTVHPIIIHKGTPLVLPNLWVEELLLTLKYNTARSYLDDIVILYTWASKHSISIHQRLFRLKGFSRAEIRSLSNAISTNKSGEKSSTATRTRRLQSLRSYLSFAIDFYTDALGLDYNNQLIGDNLQKRIIKRLSKLTYGRPCVESNRGPTTSLEKKETEKISAVLHPYSELNPFSRMNIRIRNYCLFHVAFETWARKGEIVLIETIDVNLGQSPSITFKEPSKNNRNKRKDGASLKTLGREIPISIQLRNLLHHYINEIRDTLIKHNTPTTSLFLSSKDGRRLSSKSINFILKKIQGIKNTDNIPQRLHPHGIRATGISEGKKQNLTNETITYIGGWSPNSRMPERYAREAFAARAQEEFKKSK